jgi:dynactin complex subunit
MKYKLKKSRFLNYMFSDFDDTKYWGTYFLNELKQNGKIEYTVEQMLSERDELPLYIMEGCSDLYDDEMVCNINQIQLID